MSIKNSLPDSELFTFIFPDNPKLQQKMGIQWIEDHEFLFRGKMYDVVHKVQSGKDIVLKCINDTQEEVLFADLDKQIEKCMQSDPVKSKTLNLLQKYNFLYFQQSIKHIEIQDFAFIQKNKFIQFYFYNLAKEIPTPPPQIS
ncbi:MAG: hypothetical protein ACOYO1_12130 [Bacteroidales bacterium]